MLFQSIALIHHKSRKSLFLALACFASIVEIICCVLFVLPAKTVELEYIGQFDIQYDVQSDESIPWDILTVEDDSQALEIFLPPVEIDLKTLAVDTKQNSYLFVYGSKNVSLSYSFWDLEFNNTIPPSKAFFWGILSNNGEIEKGKLYVFQFQRPMIPIVRYGIL